SREVLRVVRFREKPDQETARDFVESGRFLWNSGMFFWRLSQFLDELGGCQPDMMSAIIEMSGAIGEGDMERATEVFERLDSVSIDYALLEHARSVMVLPSGFVWDDVGAWDALDRTRERDSHDNVIDGNAVVLDSRDSIV